MSWVCIKTLERRKMFTLFVSYDCGGSYDKECEAKTLDELRPRMDELDKSMIRWYLEKDGEDFWEEVCDIHKNILVTMEKIVGSR